MATAPTQIESIPTYPRIITAPDPKRHSRSISLRGGMSSFAQTLIVPAFKNVLFATDFSPCSQAALPYVHAIAERYASTVHAVHVLVPEPQTIGVPLDRYPELDAKPEPGPG